MRLWFSGAKIVFQKHLVLLNYNQVGKTAQHLKELGVTKGDRVAGFVQILQDQ